MPGKILIVEDDSDFAASLELALELSGLKAILADSAESAYRLFDDEDIDVRAGFFDIKLPGEDGITCLETIRSLRPGFTGIVMTGFRDEGLIARARAAGAVEVLLKPFKMARFMELAREHVI